MAASPQRRTRRVALHTGRVLLFLLVIALIHFQYRQQLSQRPGRRSDSLSLQAVRKIYPSAALLGDQAPVPGAREVLDESGKSLGYVLTTSPEAKHIVGFSGPTNTLIAFGPDDRIVGIDILSSGDTIEHVRQVHDDERFLGRMRGWTWEEAATASDVDAVSGATLTSLAIQEAIIHRLGGSKPSLRFPDPLKINDVRTLFTAAASLKTDPTHASLWHVRDHQGRRVGSVLRTSPAADNVVGYQGPTETLLAFGNDGRVVGISLGKSYDNEEYVTYVREDEYFLKLFNDLVLDELARLDLEEAQVEGVSGATMTSMAVAQGIVLAARQHRKSLATVAPPGRSRFTWALRDLGTGVVILLGIVIGMTSLRSRKPVRLAFQLALVVYLGLINGDMLSQAMLVGWAQNGIPWRNAGGLVLLTTAAFLLPLTTRRNMYCSHLCPHGAAQHLLMRRLPWQIHVPKGLSRVLRVIPAALLAWCVLVAMTALPFSLVDIEPFDAWVFYIAGWATITVALVGLVVSLFVPMAYCRYGCPTGALLNYLRFNALSDRWSRRDWTAVALLALAVALWIV
jgi:transcriptional regulator of nitric oxide reductase